MSFARVSGERERCESLDQARLQRGGDEKKVFGPDKCKTILKPIYWLNYNNLLFLSNVQ
jgi:hypothetical protein